MYLRAIATPFRCENLLSARLANFVITATGAHALTAVPTLVIRRSLTDSALYFAVKPADFFRVLRIVRAAVECVTIRLH
jgi:hypothetical protein